MRLILAALIACIICLFFAGCHKNQNIRDEIILLQSAKVTIDEDSMLCVNGDSIFIEQQTPQFRLVVYVDSSECSPCSINKLKYWKTYLSKYNKNYIQMLILLEAKKGEVYRIENDITSSKLNNITNNIIFIDSNFVFRHKNPHVPHNSIFHTFLLNKYDSVILVGNPLKNEHIEKMFRKIVNNQLVDSIRNNPS